MAHATTMARSHRVAGATTASRRVVYLLVLGQLSLCTAFLTPSLPFAARRACSTRGLKMVAIPPINPPGSAMLSSDDPLWKGTETLDKQLLVRIDDDWFDLSRWRKAHPAGSHWIDLYKNMDATEVMYGFHSDEGMKMLKRLPKAKTIPENVPEVSQATRNFRKWRAQLVEEGWFDREWDKEAFNLLSWAATFTTGVMLAQFHSSLLMQFAAVVTLGIANTIGGWLSHDYVHGRGKWADFMRPFGYFCGGMSTTWWSDKHNVHHARTNEVTIDEDIATDPALFLWAPDPKHDAPWRKYQGLYLPLPLSILFLLWRFDSIKVAWERKLYKELFGLAAHYAVVLSFVSVPTFFGAMLVSGLMTALITTVTHQSEELFFDETPEFVEAQYRSTRDATCTNPFSEWLWGGMQYQLEHHLFPSMPRYKYPRLQAQVKAFGEANGLEFRCTDEWELLKMNVDLYRDVAHRPAVPGTKGSRPETGKSDLGSVLVANTLRK